LLFQVFAAPIRSIIVSPELIEKNRLTFSSRGIFVPTQVMSANGAEKADLQVFRGAGRGGKKITLH